MRAIWSGYVTFGLISIPVGIYSAVEATEQVRFRLLHRKDHAPIKYKKFCSKEDVEVGNDEIVKGFEVSKSKFAVVEKEELEEAREETGGTEDHAIEMLQFVDFASINPLFIESPYYLAPQKGGAKAYGVLRDALAETKRVGIARFTLRTKPLLAAMMPTDRALSLAVLRRWEELRSPSELSIPDDKAKPAELKMAKLLIDQLTGQWDPSEHPNEYRRALEKLLAQKRTFALAESREAAEEEDNVVDLMEALKRSIGKAKGGTSTAAKRAPKRAARKTSRKTAARRAGAA
jgi:DNA end-binding protein Ku